MKLKTAAFIVFLVFLQTGISFAEIVVLKNGNRYPTDRVIPMAGAYYFKIGDKTMNVALADVETIEHEAPSAPSQSDAASTRTPGQPERPVEEAELEFISACRKRMEAEASARKSDYEMTCARALGMVEGLYTGDPPSVEMFDYYFNIVEGKSFWMYLTPENGEKLKAILYRPDGPLDKQFIEFEEERRDLADRTARAREALAKAGAAPKQTQNASLYNPYLLNPYAMYPYLNNDPYGSRIGFPITAYADGFGNAYLGTGYSSFYPSFSTFYPNYFGNNDRGNRSGWNYYNNNQSNRDYRNRSGSRDVHIRGNTRGIGTRPRSYQRSR